METGQNRDAEPIKVAEESRGGPETQPALPGNRQSSPLLPRQAEHFGVPGGSWLPPLQVS